MTGVYCPNCLLELDEDRFCTCCGFTLRSGETGAQPPRVEPLDKGFPGTQTGSPHTLRSGEIGAQPVGREPEAPGSPDLAEGSPHTLRSEATGAQPRHREARLPSSGWHDVGRLAPPYGIRIDLDYEGPWYG